MLYINRQYFNREKINPNYLGMIEMAKKHDSFNGINGLLTKERGNAYQELISKIHNGNIVEIGNFMGLGISYIIDICRKNHNKIYVFDKFYYQELEDNLKKLKSETIVVAMTKESEEAAKMFSDEFFDLVFIDANHNYESVKNDILAWFPKVKKNGIISGDDYGYKYPLINHPGVDKAVDEFFKETVYTNNNIWFVIK